MTDREKVEAKRSEIVNTILSFIEKNPKDWQAGWFKVSAVPQNGLTNNNYRGINALYLWFVAQQKGYKDNRWVTFNQAKQLGASVKGKETASPILFYALYDKNTKKEYTRKTTAEMTDEERQKYEDEFVKPVLRYSMVFNAEQCVHFPEKAAMPEMTETERQQHNNEIIERIIARSEAPVLYDGGDEAFYRIDTDDIHLPEIKRFHTMQDYYATALHEIAHSTGHQSRLNRKFGKTFDADYAIEELRAEMAAVFMQMENGIELEGKHIQNHSAYLASWLDAVKNDQKIFTSAVSDAMKISDYITTHYVKAASSTDEQSNVVSEESTKEKAAIATRFAILDAARKVALDNMSYVDARYTDTYLDGTFSEYHRLEKQVQSNGVAPSLDPSLVRSAIDEFGNPLVVEHYGWYKSDVERALVDKISDADLREYATKMVYNYDSLQDNTPISKTNPMLTVEAQQDYYFTGTDTGRHQQAGFTILHDRQNDKWYLWSSDFIEGKVISPTGTRERLTVGMEAKRSEIIRTFDNGEEKLTAFDSVEQAREYWQKESARIVASREQYQDLNEYTLKRQAEKDALMAEQSMLFENAQKKNPSKSIEDVNVPKPSMNDQLKDWYIKTYPEDMFGLRLIGTFQDLQSAIDNGADANGAVMGIDNPIARERIFSHLAELQGINVSDIHKKANAANKSAETNAAASKQTTVDENAQKKNPSMQATSSTSSQKWQRVTIPTECIGKEYGWRTMVSLPKSSGYVGFAMFVPTKMLQKQADGSYQLLYDNTKKDFLKATNDGREVVFDGETLDKVMRGEKVPYQAKRVRAGKEAQKMVEQTLANIPSEMQEMERWCVHQKYFDKNAKGERVVKKRIFDVNRIDEPEDNYAKCNDSSTWASIDRATSTIRTNKKALTGLTFVIGEGISVVDLDHCFDSAGKPSALAADLMSAFEGTTYMEKSMSGTGLHIFVKGDLRNGGKFGKVNKDVFGDIEVYDENKFMSVTGNIIGDVRTLGTVTAAQQAAVQKYLKAEEIAQKKSATTPKRSYTGSVSDDDVIAKIRASKRGAEFDSLYAGHKEGQDWSREDYALINTIAFFTPNQDRNQIQRIFEHSGLYRPQKGEKYLNRTIDVVLSRLRNPTNIWNNQSGATAAKPKAGGVK